VLDEVCTGVVSPKKVTGLFGISSALISGIIIGSIDGGVKLTFGESLIIKNHPSSQPLEPPLV
jgi:hypothetical protein